MRNSTRASQLVAHFSRRDLEREIQLLRQGNGRYIRALTALLIQQEGVITIKRENIALVEADMHITANANPDTGDQVLSLQYPGKADIAPVEEAVPA